MPIQCNWFKFEQGNEQKKDSTTETKAQAISQTVTIVGTVKINNRNAWSDDVKKVYIKGQTLGAQNTLSNNKFVLRDVAIKPDKIIEIAIDLKNNLSNSEMFKLPQPDKDNVSDVGEVLIEVKPPVKSKTQGVNSLPQLIINNTNIQNNH